MKYIRDIIKNLYSILVPRRSVTVRYMFPVILGALAILGASVITGTEGSYIELVPSTTTVMSGERFYIEVFAFAHVPVNALDVDIKFIPETVEIIGVDTGQSVLTVWTQEPLIKNNLITFGGGTYRRGFVGRHSIAVIEVKALKTGETEFTIAGAELLAGDGQGTPVAITEDQAKTRNSFIIYDQNNSPEQISAELGLSITADIDKDGKVTLRDISAFMSAWYTKEKTYDFNNDKKMNFVDFSIILAKSVQS